MINTVDHIINIDLAKKINTNQSISIKKNDTNSHEFLINIFNNSVAYDLTSTTSRIYFEKADGEKVFLDCILDGAIVNKLSVLLTTQALTYAGTVASEITIYGTGGEILTSVTFNFTVLDLIRDDAAIESTSEFTALTNALALVTDFSNVKTEIVASRLGEVDLPTKIGKIDSSLADTVKYQSQVDFVDIIKDRTSYSRMRFQKLNATTFLVSVDNKKTHATYKFIKDPNDDFIKIDDGFVGQISTTQISFSIPEDLVGTWVTTSPPSYYASVVGATFTAKAKGSTLKLTTRKDDRGGVWSIVVDDNTANPILISTWALVDTISGVNTFIKDGLDPLLYHTILGTFIGDDPLNVPSGGAGTSRCWLNSTSALSGQIDTNVKEKGLLATLSNKEMAFSITNGLVTNWVPEHSNVGSAYKNPSYEPIYLLDDVAVDFTTMAIDDFVECTDFKLVQRVYGVIDSENVVDISLTHHVGLSGVISWSGNLEVLKDIKFNSMYPLMIPLDQTVINECLTSIGNSKISAGDETDFYFPEESDLTLSCAGVSSSYRDYVVAGTVQFPKKTMRIGEIDGKPPITKNIRFWERAISPKIYFTAGQTLFALTGDSYSWFGEIAIAKIPYIYNALKG